MCHCIGVGTNVAGGAIAPPLFYKKKETHLLALQIAKQTGLYVTGNAIIQWQEASLVSPSQNYAESAENTS